MSRPGDTLGSVRRGAFGLVFAALFPACDSGTAPAPANVTYEAGPPTGPCDAVEQQHAIEGQTHVPECSVVHYGTKPPSSGDHYGVWAAFKIYSNPIPEGYFVHDLEHGAIVFSYNCPSGCDADVSAASATLAALPPDPLCLTEGTARRRDVMTPDPHLDVPFAASAWGFTLRAKCFDPEVFRSFAERHYGQGPEALCADGVDLSGGVSPGCGGP